MSFSGSFLILFRKGIFQRKCPSGKMIPLLYFSVYITFRSCYITDWGSEFRIKNATFLAFVFHHKICVFIIFIPFFDEVSNFGKRILTNQKQKLVVQNFQWNCVITGRCWLLCPSSVWYGEMRCTTISKMLIILSKINNFLMFMKCSPNKNWQCPLLMKHAVTFQFMVITK